MADGITSLLQFIPGFLQLMHGMNNGGQKQTAAQLANVTNAMTNPDNPLYQKMYGQYKQQGQQQLGENISQMEGQNRMLAGMGRAPLFSPERQGEQAFRAQAAAGPQIGIQAQQQTQGALQNAAHALNPYGQSNTYQNLLSSQYSPERRGYGATGQSIAGLSNLSNFMGQQPQQQRPPQMPWQMPNQGVNAPGAQQGNSLLDMLKGMF